MAALESTKNDTIEHKTLGQLNRSNIKAWSRPVVSTVHPKHATRPREVIQGSRVKDSNIVMDLKSEEIQRLENEVKRLREGLSKAESTIKKLMKRDKEMSERLSEELQRHVKQSGKFENLTQGGLRLNHLIERYEMLYSQGRIDALDELDEIPQLKKMKKREEIKSRIMVGVMIASFRICKDHAKLIRQSIWRLLGVTNTSQYANEMEVEIESHINQYLQATSEKFNIENIVKDLEDQLREILPEFPDSFTSKPHMASYICECVRISWAIVNQVPPIEIEYNSERYSSMMHRRFHTSDEKSHWIKCYAWPTLVNANDKNIITKGVVIT